jgi:hypothetical protein
MTWLLVGLGAVLVAGVIADIQVTLLHPSARGLLSYQVNRWSWRLVRRLSIWLGSRRLLTFAGPFAFAMNFIAWVLGAWFGFALAYAPFVDDFAYSPDVPFGAKGFMEALYISGISLTTVGFGDVVASSDALRLVTVFESACGFGVFTAAVTYVVAVYPLVTGIRASALLLAEQGVTRPGRAARAATDGGPTELSALQRALIENDENIKRFPILYYFESGDQSESISTLLRAGIVTTIVLRWGTDSSGVPCAPFYGPALEATVRRLMEDYEINFVGGRSRSRREHNLLDEEDVRLRYEDLQAELAEEEVETSGGGPGDEPPEAFREFVSRSEAFLAQLAREHCNAHEPLLCERREQPERPGAVSALTG